MVAASFDFCRANLNEVSSAGTSIPSESLNPTARLPESLTVYITLIDRPFSWTLSSACWMPTGVRRPPHPGPRAVRLGCGCCVGHEAEHAGPVQIVMTLTTSDASTASART